MNLFMGRARSHFLRGDCIQETWEVVSVEYDVYKFEPSWTDQQTKRTQGVRVALLEWTVDVKAILHTCPEGGKPRLLTPLVVLVDSVAGNNNTSLTTTPRISQILMVSVMCKYGSTSHRSSR